MPLQNTGYISKLDNTISLNRQMVERYTKSYTTKEYRKQMIRNTCTCLYKTKNTLCDTYFLKKYLHFFLQALFNLSVILD